MEAASRLYLLRHAKSDWDDPDLEDHERPLSPRGERATVRLAAYFRRQALEPDLVLCSTAVRARQTLTALALKSEVRFEDGLYGASAAGLLARLHRVPDDVGSVMIVGHNPGLQHLAVRLAGMGDPLLLARVGENLPTGALVTLAFPPPWASLTEDAATLTALIVPRQLET